LEWQAITGPRTAYNEYDNSKPKVTIKSAIHEALGTPEKEIKPRFRIGEAVFIPVYDMNEAITPSDGGSACIPGEYLMLGLKVISGKIISLSYHKELELIMYLIEYKAFGINSITGRSLRDKMYFQEGALTRTYRGCLKVITKMMVKKMIELEEHTNA